MLLLQVDVLVAWLFLLGVWCVVLRVERPKSKTYGLTRKKKEQTPERRGKMEKKTYGKMK